MNDNNRYLCPLDQYHGNIQIPEFVWRSSISWAAKVLYGRMARYCPNGRKFCYPSQQTLALELDVTERQIRRYLKELADSELIDIKIQPNGRSNQYWFRSPVDNPVLRRRTDLSDECLDLSEKRNTCTTISTNTPEHEHSETSQAKEQEQVLEESLTVAPLVEGNVIKGLARVARDLGSTTPIPSHLKKKLREKDQILKNISAEEHEGWRVGLVAAMVDWAADPSRGTIWQNLDFAVKGPKKPATRSEPRRVSMATPPPPSNGSSKARARGMDGLYDLPEPEKILIYEKLLTHPVSGEQKWDREYAVDTPAWLRWAIHRYCGPGEIDIPDWKWDQLVVAVTANRPKHWQAQIQDFLSANRTMTPRQAALALQEQFKF